MYSRVARRVRALIARCARFCHVLGVLRMSASCACTLSVLYFLPPPPRVLLDMILNTPFLPPAPPTPRCCVCGSSLHQRYEVVGGACVDVDDCLTTPCQNGGTCTDTGVNTVSCACPPEFGGEFCEADSDDCASNPCASSALGGAECVDTGLFEFNCTCLNGWTGLLCQHEPQCSGFSDAGSGTLPRSCVCDAYGDRYQYPCCANTTAWLDGDSTVCTTNFDRSSDECQARYDAAATCEVNEFAADSIVSVCRNTGCESADKAGGAWCVCVCLCLCATSIRWCE